MRNGLGQDFRKGPNGCPPPKNPCPCPGCRKRLGLGQGHFEFKSPIWMPPPEKLWQILAKKGILIYNNAIKPAIFHKNLSCQTKKRKILLYSIPLYYYFFFGGGHIIMSIDLKKSLSKSVSSLAKWTRTRFHRRLTYTYCKSEVLCIYTVH